MDSNEKLSRAERLILINQYRILEHLEPDAEEDWQLLRQVLEEGYELEYYTYTGIHDPLPESECELVCSILQMCWDLQRHLAELDDLPELLYRDEVESVGFDGNHETAHMQYAEFLIEKCGKFKGINSIGTFNSHSPRLPIYKQLLAKYSTELRNNRFGRDRYSQEMITRILA